ncbi:glutamate-5-semialdehyde dehydrogenase [Yunchengibacter salinarum]|uniref:glutamate-5-semialdehyde dehydrogenase n=1 Tax=Yunchengibacter salinarum TaxID=3133399 RepID=UPI0035B60659
MDGAHQSDTTGLIADLGHRARAATGHLAQASRADKDQALKAAATRLRTDRDAILAANEKDVAAAGERGLSSAMVDRLRLDDERLESMALGLEAIADLPDPVGREMARWDRPNGLDIARVAVPLGVIGVIYESRPNVTADAGALCLKAGNAVILRGGSEAVHSNHAIHACLKAGLKDAGLPEDAIQIVPTQDRAAVGAMLAATGLIDIIVPRGGRGLVARVENESRVPVFAHLEGICHVYIHEKADPAKARDIAFNAKMRRTGICGAMETLLIDRAMLPHAMDILRPLMDAGCEIRGDGEINPLDPAIKAADSADWDTEYLDAILSVAVVDNVDQAIAHIARHSSGHTESIVTEDRDAAETFLGRVDSAIVMTNASTQFADGGEFGMGAEIGIATGRIHARGPVGLEQLTSFKYQVRGTGQTRP